MRLYEIQPTGTVAELLRSFSNLGGVIDYVLIRLENPLPSDYDLYELHKAAAVFTIQTATARHLSDPERGPRIEPEKASGTRIELAELFAPACVWIPSTELPGFPWNDTTLLLTFPRVETEGSVCVSFGSYAYVFSNPPYSLRVSQSRAEKLFSAMNQQLFGDTLTALTIYRWSTDWADYFNPGNEWWGSHLWTVHNTTTNALVGIAASATD